MNNDLYNSDWINIDGNSIHKTAIIHPNVKLGTGNTIGAYCVIGGNGEIRGKNQNEFKGRVVIGDNNVISEHVTIQRPFVDTITHIGNNNLIMAHAHIGHDVFVDDNCEICTSSVIGGYATICKGAKIKLHSVIRNRITIGKNAIVGMGSVVTKDVQAESTVFGNPAREKEVEKSLINDIENIRKEIRKFGNATWENRWYLFCLWIGIAIGGFVCWLAEK